MQTSLNTIWNNSKTFFILYRKELLFFWLITMGIPAIFESFVPVNISNIEWMSLHNKAWTIFMDMWEQFNENSIENYPHGIYHLFEVRHKAWWYVLQWLVYVLLFQHIKNSFHWVKNTIKGLFYKIRRLIGTSFLAWLCLAWLYLLLIIPGIIYSVFWVFITPLILYTSLSWREVMKKSKSLVQWRWRKTIRFLFIIYFIYWIVLAITVIVLLYGYALLWRNPVIDLVSTFISAPIEIFLHLLLWYFFLAWYDSTHTDLPHNENLETSE